MVKTNDVTWRRMLGQGVGANCDEGYNESWIYERGWEHGEV